MHDRLTYDVNNIPGVLVISSIGFDANAQRSYDPMGSYRARRIVFAKPLFYIDKIIKKLY